jgi:hypothetical protein
MGQYRLRRENACVGTVQGAGETAKLTLFHVPSYSHETSHAV